MMKRAVIYIHGKGGNAGEAGHYRPFFPQDTVLGFDYAAGTPWEAKDEFSSYFTAVGKRYDSLILIANSIGAYFTMCADTGEKVEKAFFISPIVDMENLIMKMMTWAGVTEDELKAKKEIPTAFGEKLSWEYLCYVRAHPVRWTVPTGILYGGKDDLTSPETVRGFAEKCGASLTVMPEGEHWFHTEAQMAFLRRWLERALE